MVALRIILLIIATALAAYWANDFIQTGEPSLPVAMALMVIGIALTVTTVASAFKRGGETGK